MIRIRELASLTHSFVAARRTAMTIAALASAVIIVVFPGPLLWVHLHGLDLTAVERLEAEAAMRTSVMQLLGGCLLLAGLVFTSRSLRLTREGHITDRYAAAIEQLGHTAIDVRLGGIFALERIARDSPPDRSTMIEVLTAYIRNHTTASPREPKRERIEADVQAALTVLGRRRTPEDEQQRLNLTHCGLVGADLRGNFDRANFHYSILDNAVFTGGSFVGAGLSFTKGTTVGFNRADARDASFVHASFVKSWFINSDLTNADFFGCDLTDTDMGKRDDASGAPSPASRLHGARFNDAILARTILVGSDLSEVSGLTAKQLAHALTDESTVPPSTMD